MSTATAPRTRRAPGRIPAVGTLPAILIGLLLTVGPLIVVVAFSFMTRPASGGGIVYQFSLDAYREFLFTRDFHGVLHFDPGYLTVVRTSLVQAGITTVVCLLLAFPLALWMATRPPRVQRMLLLLVTIPFWTNLLVRTYAWLLVLNDGGLINDVLGAVGLPQQKFLYGATASQLGLIYTFLPFMVLPLYSSLSGFDFRLAEAAADLGAHHLRTLRRVILPMARPGIVSGILLVFMPAFGAYVQPVLLGGGKVLLVGSLIASQFGDSRNWPFGAALSVIILLLLGGALWGLMAWSRRTGTRLEVTL
ncbi:ABC transporter permease [Actinotalea sp.]|uniref:ABC transporter permease n=1 Tax=Actinotalea sp. TaxID=1872145 RepID=UPI00356B1769